MITIKQLELEFNCPTTATTPSSALSSISDNDTNVSYACPALSVTITWRQTLGVKISQSTGVVHNGQEILISRNHKKSKIRNKVYLCFYVRSTK